MKKFKRLVVLVFCMMISLGIYAGRVNESDALKKAQAFMPGQKFEMKKYASSSTGGAGQEPFFIFNVANGGGFVLVSADDQTVPILGYSTMGNIDLNNIPDNVSYWLESYAEQLKALEEGKLEVPKRNTQSTRGDIAPLIQSEWNQGYPYNLMCPDGNGVDYTSADYNPNNRTVTGCVATAVAQVMYYHKKPSQTTTTIPAYTFSINGNSATLEELPVITLEWDKMKETYGGKDSEESREAVAKLMRYVGQAFKMNYDVEENGGSATQIYTDAMVDYFNYSKKIHQIYRDYYTTSQWEDLVYNELSHNRPVPYSGRTSGNAGHQFVCDGYSQSDGLFHLNWGWGGSLDGYFILSIADPNGQQGIGGSNEAFKYSQACVLNFMPAEINEEEVPLFISEINPNITSKDYSRSSDTEDFTGVTLSGRFYVGYAYKPTTTYNVEIGWGLYLNEELKGCVGYAKSTIDNRNFEANSYFFCDYSMNVSFGKELEDGKYQLRQIFRKADSSDAWQLCDNYGTNYLVAEINGNSLHVRGIDVSAKFLVNSMSVSSKPYVGGTVTVDVDLTNTGETNKGEVCLWAAKDGTSDWVKVANQMIYIDPGATSIVSFTYVPNESGQYNLKITSGDSDEPLKTTSIDVASVKEVTIDDIVYQCVPEYGIATIVFGGNDRTKSSLTIPSAITVDDKECIITAIGDQAFFNWYILETLTIPEGIETIGAGAFAYCFSLTKVELPSTLVSIGNYAFLGSNSLTDLISHIETPFAISDDVFKILDFETNEYFSSQATLYVPAGTKSKYEAITGWTQFAGIEELESTAKLGDANGDGEITISDAVLIISYVIGETPSGFNLTNADVNKDGNVTVADAVKVIDMITP